MAKHLKQYLPLFLISFAILFFELMIIRWSAAEIKVLAFFKNIVLIAILVGLGLGCAKPNAQFSNNTGNKALTAFSSPIVIFNSLFLILCTIFSLAPFLGLTNMKFAVSNSTFEMISANAKSIGELLCNILKMTGIYLLIVATFDYLGRNLAEELRDKSPLPAYTVNLLGSLAGTVVFSLLCFLRLPPNVWVLIGFMALVYFNRHSVISKLVFLITLCASICLINFADGQSIWSPYYRINYEPYICQSATPYKVGDIIYSNRDFLCRTINLSDDFIKQHPEIRNSKEYLHYNLPYSLLAHPHNILLIGTGAGNDVAGALRANVDHIDAVEIDPVIKKLGEKLHPEHPYQNKKVTAYIDDARAFLTKTKSFYDFIAFCYLDSHTALSTASSVRLDNYLYTKEAIKTADSHLTPTGVGMLSFGAKPIWLRNRLYQLVCTVQKGPEAPIFLDTGFDHNGISILWGPGLEKIRKQINEKYSQYVMPVAQFSKPVELTTDDWPFLYNESRNLPPLYITVFGILWLASYVLIYLRFRFTPKQFLDNTQFFFLGAGFLLLETRGLLTVALLFGSTWFVNSIMFATVIIMALIANIITERYGPILQEKYCYVGIFGSLLLIYFSPVQYLNTLPAIIKCASIVVLLGLPFLFSGLIFSRAFSRTNKPNLALGINILGALLGGCLEYTSLIIGSNNLLILAAVCYLSALICDKKLSSILQTTQ